MRLIELVNYFVKISNDIFNFEEIKKICSLGVIFMNISKLEISLK